MAPQPAVETGGGAEAETPKAPKRSSRRLGYTQCSQYCPPEPKVVWDCQSPDATALARPDKCVLPGEFFDQPGSVVDKGDSSGNPETPPLVRIWLKERTIARAEGVKETGNACKGRRTRLPLTNLSGPVKKLCRPSSSDDYDAATCASALDFIRNEHADSAADRELFFKLAAVVGVKQDASASLARASDDGEPSDSSDDSFTLPQPEEPLCWSDQSSFEEMSFTTTPSVVAPAATGGSLLAARSPLMRATSSGRAGRSRLPAPLVTDARSSGTPATGWSSSGRPRPGKGIVKHKDPAVEGPPFRTVGCTTVRGGTGVTGTLPAADLSSELRVTLPRRADVVSDVDAAGNGTSGDSRSSHGSQSRAPVGALAGEAATAPGSTKGAATRAPLITAVVSSAAPTAVAASHRVQAVACSGPRRSPRVAARAPGDHQRQPPAYGGLSAVVAESTVPAVPSCSGGVRRQLRLPAAGSLDCASAATGSSSCAQPGARGTGAIVGSSEVAVSSRQHTALTADGSAVSPQQGALTAAAGAAMQPTTSAVTVRDSPTTAPADRAQPRHINHHADLASAVKVVNLWDTRHRSDVLLKKGGPDATVVVAQKGWQSAIAGNSGTGAASAVGGNSVCSQGSNSGSTVRCSSEEIARKRLEALERRRKAAGMQNHAVTQPAASATNTGAAFGSTGSMVTAAPPVTSTDKAIGRTGSAEAQPTNSASMHTGAGGSTGSQPSSRCSSEEIARKRKEALERKMRKAAASATQSVAMLSGGSAGSGHPTKAAHASAAAADTAAASVVKRTLLGR